MYGRCLLVWHGTLLATFATVLPALAELHHEMISILNGDNLPTFQDPSPDRKIQTQAYQEPSSKMQDPSLKIQDP